MTKIALIFPGQGAQYVGMSGELIEFDSELRIRLARFKERTGIDLAKVMLEGPEEKLKETWITQPAILFHSIAAYRSLEREIELKPSYVAGHSLGEFSALVANGVLSYDDALYLVHKRGEFMIKASGSVPYAMSAIIGLSSEVVQDICNRASSEGTVIAANYNTPVQTVISGSKAGVEQAEEYAKESGAKRVVRLVVGGAFHSPLVSQAAGWLESEMNNLNFSPTGVPIVSNVDARGHVEISKIKENLIKQVTSSVRWVESVEYMAEQGVELFIEFGPQKVLSGMLRKIDRKLKTVNVEKPSDIEKVKAVLER